MIHYFELHGLQLCFELLEKLRDADAYRLGHHLWLYSAHKHLQFSEVLIVLLVSIMDVTGNQCDELGLIEAIFFKDALLASK